MYDLGRTPYSRSLLVSIHQVNRLQQMCCRMRKSRNGMNLHSAMLQKQWTQSKFPKKVHKSATSLSYTFLETHVHQSTWFTNFRHQISLCVQQEKRKTTTTHIKEEAKSKIKYKKRYDYEIIVSELIFWFVHLYKVCSFFSFTAFPESDGFVFYVSCHFIQSNTEIEWKRDKIII